MFKFTDPSLSVLDFFTNRSKTLNIIVNPELNTGHSLADFSYNEELHQDLNVLTVIPLDHYGNFLSLTLDDWSVITSKVQFPEHLDFNQLLSIFWETQPILVVTDIARSEVHDSDFFQQSLVKQVNLAYSRDIASEYAPEDVHYISQSFDLDKLMRCGVYLQGHCYSAHDFVINNHNLFEKDSLIVPVFNIHSTQKELQQFLVFDLQGKFLDCVVGTEVLY
ncbi:MULTISPECIES: hypothetical protein [Acinetobacter]|uniref:hypothetical protein n=2 Tax=Moraxellaceae TaxID=468 RepID=UPI00109C87E9|nr:MULTISPECIES: hypothetical protein [Acinetobacter]MCE6238593.1 hypothetical protein [Acinetobacter pittii]MCE6693347.1 hypothetical protein [Acinetobacter pittii]MCE6700799.1 hypothetical protein [Acinetobacter pittii]NHC01361.1 hypothetical protein [Acinetobacter sp. GFQ9D192M]